MKVRLGCGRRVDRECKDNAVALARGGRSLCQVSRDPGVSQWPVGRWVHAADSGRMPRGLKILTAVSEETRELRRMR